MQGLILSTLVGLKLLSNAREKLKYSYVMIVIKAYILLLKKGNMKTMSELKIEPNEVIVRDVQETKHGKWEEIRDAYRQLEGWIHIECGREVKIKENYCPCCGAKMEENNA